MHLSSGPVIFFYDNRYKNLLQFHAVKAARRYKLQFRNDLNPLPVSRATGSPAPYKKSDLISTDMY